jgi:Transposase
MRRFLKNLANWGLVPRVVVTDGSSLYPAVLAELWPAARHQLCIFHVLKDVNELILKGVRRLARAMARRGNGGRKRRRGRPSKARRAARAAGGPTNKEKAAFVMKHRFLIAKKIGDLSKQHWDDLGQMFDYLPRLRALWHFATEANDLFEKEGRVQTLYKRRAALLRKEAYREVPELEEAMGMLEEGKFKKMVAFSHSEAGEKVRTNNHVERANRRLRFAEKVRYKWRHRKWVLRHVLLALDRWWRQAAEAARRDEEQRPQPRSRVA